MNHVEIDSGLRRLAALAPDFEIGKMRFDTDTCPLRLNGKLALEVSREVLEDLQGSRQVEGHLRRGIQLAREEAGNSGARVDPKLCSAERLTKI